MTNDKISIVIPCYNGENFLNDCIKSILKQTVKPNEIILIDDGSTDDSLKIAKKYQIKIVSHKVNRGLAEARNTGIKSTNSEIIIFIDVDCVADKNLIKNIIENYTSEKIAGVGGIGVEVNSNGSANKYRSLHGIQGQGKHRKFVECLFGLCFSFRKKVLQEVGLFDHNFRTNGEDIDIGFRITKKGYRLIYDPQIKVLHLRDDKNLNSYRKSVYNYFYYGSLAHLKNKNKANRWLIKAIIRIFFKYFKNMVEDLKNLRFDIFHINILLIKEEIISALRVYKFYNKKYNK